MNTCQMTECVVSASGCHLGPEGAGEVGGKLLDSCQPYISSSFWSPDSSPPGCSLSLLNSGHDFTLERQPPPSPSSLLIDVTAVPGATLLIFNVDSTAAELQARRAGGGCAEPPWGREEGTDGKELH